MTDEQETYADDTELETASDIDVEDDQEQVELEADSDELDTAEDTSPDDPELDEDAESEDDEPDDDLIEINVNGETIKAPKEFAPLKEMQAYNTQNAQRNADDRKALETAKQQIEQQAKMSEDEFKARVTLNNIDQRLSALSETDWETLKAEDPLTAQERLIELQQLQASKNEWGSHLESIQGQLGEQAKAEMNDRIRQTDEYAMKHIRGWSTKMAEETQQFAEAHGISKQEFVNALTPTTLKILHLARVGEKTLSKTPANARPKKQAQPTRTVKSKVSPKASSNLADMDMDSYAKARRKQMGMS